MGRYDRIRVFDGTNWRQPRKIFVYNGTNWVDLKADDDVSSSGTLHVYDSIWKDATKHYVSTSQTYYGDWYTVGEFTIANANNYCYCANSSTSGYNRTWDFSCTVRKTSDTDRLVLYVGGSNEGAKIKVIWLADGRIKVECRYSSSGTTHTMYSSNSVGTWGGFVSLRIYQSRGSNTMHIIFNGQETTQTMYGAFTISNAIGKAGSDGINFMYNFYLEGGANSGYGYGTLNNDAINLTSNKSRDSWTEYSGHWE
jgi:hypothetical protein